NPYVPGQTLTYTVTATNHGPSDVTGAPVSDPLPGALNGAGFTWTCTTSGTGNACGAASGSGDIATTINLANGGVATFTITGTVPSGTRGNCADTARLTPPTGATAPATTKTPATDNSPANPQADLNITKVSSPNPYVPGQTLTYTVTVTNNGPSNVVGAAVSD